MSPPDRQQPGNPVEELLRLLARLRGHRAAGPRTGPSTGRRAWPAILIGLLVILALFTSLYKIDTEETGVLLRFGQFAGFAEPGLHLKLPFGIDRVYRAATGRVNKEEFGFRTLQTGVRSTYAKKGYEDESLTLTGDLNVTDVEWIVQYRIADPFKFLFHVHDPQEAIRDLAEAMVRKVIGTSNVNEVLTTDRAMLSTVVEKDLQTLLDQYDIGVRIVTVKFQDVTPPNPVKSAFNEVNEAEQQKESLIFQAREQYNKEVPKARGVARRTILEAEGYALERINQARGESSRFSALLAEYRKAPEVTKQRLYLETMEEILPKLKEIYVMDRKTGGALPLLPLRGEPKGEKP